MHLCPEPYVDVRTYARVTRAIVCVYTYAHAALAAADAHGHE